MKILNILVILGVIAVVTAVGIAINAGITGHSIFGGDSQDSAFDYSKSGLFGGGSPSSGDSSSNNSTDLVNNTEENITIIENETKSSGGGGGGGNSNNVIPDEFCDFIDNDLDGEIDEIGCANVYGTIYNVDTNDTLEGINISFYDSEVYDTFNDTGNYSALVPKEIPDAVTDENGNYNVSILEGIYHMVLQGSKEEDFNIHANASNGALKHDVELNENTASDNFNAEGHILFSGKYEQNNGNKYVCGDKLKFVMFGINHGEENETITFMVEDHTVNHGTNGDSVYNGSILDDDESLTIPAEEKVYKNFEFEIPCGYNLGKYDIHVVWDDSKWHKIGNFFVVGDTTSPGINADDTASGLPGENITIDYLTWNNAQPGTVGANEISISEGMNDTLTVLVDKENDDNNDYEIYGGGAGFINLTYNASGSYIAKLTVKDKSENENSTEVNVIIYISEEEAAILAIPIYESFGLNIINNTNRTINASSPDVFLNVDRYNDAKEVGDEYMTTNNNVHSEDSSNSEENQINGLNAVIEGRSGPEYVKPIYPSTQEGYISILTEYLNYLKNWGII